MLANQAEVHKKRSDETLLQSSAVGDSKANVIAERAQRGTLGHLGRTSSRASRDFRPRWSARPRRGRWRPSATPGLDRARSLPTPLARPPKAGPAGPPVRVQSLAPRQVDVLLLELLGQALHPPSAANGLQRPRARRSPGRRRRRGRWPRRSSPRSRPTQRPEQALDRVEVLHVPRPPPSSVNDPAAVIEDPLHHQPLVPVAGIVLVPDQETRSCAPSARFSHGLHTLDSLHRTTSNRSRRDPRRRIPRARNVEPRSDAELVVGTGLGVGAEVSPLALRSSEGPNSRVS